MSKLRHSWLCGKSVYYDYETALKYHNAKHLTHYVEISPEHDAAIAGLVEALKYNKNEMNYRIFQIKDGREIPMIGEMYTAVKKAEEALDAYRAVK